MLNVQELDSSLTGLAVKYDKSRTEFGETFIRKANFSPIKDFKLPVVDTIQEVLLDNYNLTDKVAILQSLKSNIGNSLTSIDRRKKIHAVDVKRLNKFEIAIHEKYVLGFSCIVLFFVGAPLGAIIRKGGLGLPIVVGVVLFLTFHFIGIFAKNSAEDGTISAFTASWLSTFITLPIGVYLTYRATTDQGLIDLDPVRLFLQKIFGKKKKEEVVEEEKIEYTLTAEEEALLDARSINQLKEIVKNYKQYDYSDALRYGALDRLDTLGITKENLKVQGFYENTTYNKADKYYADFKKYNKYALINYLVYIVLFAVALFAPQVIGKTPSIVLAYQISQIAFLVIFYVLLILTLISVSRYYKTIGKRKEQTTWLFIFILVFGIPAYLLIHFYYKKIMKESLQMIR